MVPEIQNTSLQTIQQLGWKTFLRLKTTGYYKIEVYYLLRNISTRQKNYRAQCTGINFSSKSIKINFLKVLYIIHTLSSACFHTPGPHGTFPKPFVSPKCIEFNRLSAKGLFLHCSFIFLQFLIQPRVASVSFHSNLVYSWASFQL